MAGLSDVLTTAKNIVTAINNLAQTYLDVQGTSTTEAISTATVIKPAPGRVVEVSVTTAGNSTGTLYDSTTTSNTTRPLYVIPTAVGLYDVNLPTNYGLTAAPGGNQVITVSWS